MRTDKNRAWRAYLSAAEERRARHKSALSAELERSGIPVPDPLYRGILGLFITDAIEVLRSHPGFQAEDSLRSLRTTYGLFGQACDDLTDALDAFDRFSRTPAFGARAHRDRLVAIESRIRKEIVCFSELSHSLKELCYRLCAHWDPPGMDARRAATFGDDGLHDFVCSLRNILHHQSMLEVRWRIRESGADSRSDYTLRRLELDAHDLNEKARQYLATLPDEINVRTLIHDYEPRVRAFYDWLLATCEASVPEAVADYRRCWRGHRRQTLRMEWNVMLTVFLERGVDPYPHLEQYLTPAEMANAMRLPKHSREQADFIINAVDEDGACTDHLRSLVYRLFRVPDAKSRPSG